MIIITQYGHKQNCSFITTPKKCLKKEMSRIIMRTNYHNDILIVILGVEPWIILSELHKHP